MGASMKVVNKEELLDSFFDLYSEKLEDIVDRSEKIITADDIISINLDLLLFRNNIDYRNANEEDVKCLFTNYNYLDSVEKLKSMIDKLNLDPFDAASDIMIKISQNKIFKNHNVCTAVSSGLYYLYKNKIMVTLSKEDLTSLSTWISESPTEQLSNAKVHIRNQLKENSDILMNNMTQKERDDFDLSFE